MARRNGQYCSVRVTHPAWFLPQLRIYESCWSPTAVPVPSVHLACILFILKSESLAKDHSVFELVVHCASLTELHVVAAREEVEAVLLQTFATCFESNSTAYRRMLVDGAWFCNDPRAKHLGLSDGELFRNILVEQAGLLWNNRLQ